MKKGWVMKKLSDIVTKASSNISQNQLMNEDGDYPIYGAGGLIRNVNFYHQNKEYISIVKDGAGIGRIATLPAYSSVIGTLQYLIPKEVIDTKFLYYILSNVDFNKYRNGSTIPHIYFKDYSEEQVPTPPLPEQQRIVSVLDEAFTSIAQAKSNAERNLVNSRELFESVMQEIFSNSHDGWEKKSLEELGKITSSKRIYKNEYVKKGIPFYRIKEVKELANKKDISIELFISNKRYQEIKEVFGVPAEGDLLMTAVGTIGEIYVVKKDDEFYFKDGNVLWFKDFKSIDPNFLKFALIVFIEKIRRLSAGAAYSALTIEKIEKHIIFVPALAEQRAIVGRLKELSAETGRLEEIYKSKIAGMEELKKSILQKAFAGEIG